MVASIPISPFLQSQDAARSLAWLVGKFICGQARGLCWRMFHVSPVVGAALDRRLVGLGGFPCVGVIALSSCHTCCGPQGVHCLRKFFIPAVSVDGYKVSLMTPAVFLFQVYFVCSE